MNDSDLKLVSSKERKETAIGKWWTPKGYKLYLCDLTIETFKLNFMLSFGTLEEFARFVKARDNQDVDIAGGPQAMYVWHPNKNGVGTSRYILFTENEWLPKDYGTMCHELHHATHRSLSDLGTEYGLGGEEIFAYIQGHLMENCVRALWELHKSLDKKIGKKTTGLSSHISGANIKHNSSPANPAPHVKQKRKQKETKKNSKRG